MRNRGGDKQQQQQQSMSDGNDDMKISKLLRRLQAETRLTATLEICAKLKIALADPSNGTYVRRSFDILADNVVAAMEMVASEAEDAVVEVFGLMGFILRNEFSTYKAWIVKTYKNHKHLKVPMMKSLSETLALDPNGAHFKHFSARLIELLKDFLEGADNAAVFLAVLSTIIRFSQTFPKEFSAHFTDIVDICIGWHLETETRPEIRAELSKMLQGLAPFWRVDIPFTKSLLGQFLEDIEACNHDSNASLGSFISAFNTTIKCLQPPDLVVSILGEDFIRENFTKIIILLKEPIGESRESQLILPVNEFCLLLLQLYPFLSADPDSLVNTIEDVIQEEVKRAPAYELASIESLLKLVVAFVGAMKNDLSLNAIEMLISTDSNLMKLKFLPAFNCYQGEFMEMFHQILDIKNVAIMQHAYKLILIDLQRCFNAMNGKF